MGGLPQAQYSVHSSANPSASGIKYDPFRYGLKPGKYRVKHLGHSTQWRTREAMASVDELLRGLFPSAPVVNNLGHVDIRVTHLVPHNLRPGAFAQHMVGVHGTEASKYPFYRSNRPSPDLRKNCLPTFAGKVIFGCARATSAIDVPMLASTGVAR